MITFENITMKNFLSTGAVTQSIALNRQDLTLILGENLDLGGDGARNGTGKCCGINTVVRVRNKLTGEIYETTMGDLYAKASQNRDNSQNTD